MYQSLIGQIQNWYFTMSLSHMLSGNQGLAESPTQLAVCRFCKLLNRTRFLFDRHSRMPLAGIKDCEWIPACAGMVDM